MHGHGDGIDIFSYYFRKEDIGPLQRKCIVRPETIAWLLEIPSEAGYEWRTKVLRLETLYRLQLLDEKQQQAAKDFLHWLVYDEDGQDFLVNKCNLVPAFSNIDLEVTNPLGASVQKYTADEKIFETFANLPGDHWKTLGAEMQKYLGDQCTREELEASIESYWQKQ